MKKKTSKIEKKPDKEDEIVEEKVKKSVLESEENQLFWFIVIIVVLFASFLVPYFYIQSQKIFSFAGADWTIEDYGDVTFYHGRFQSFNGNSMHNLYLRLDPRKNDVKTVGDFNNFFYGGVVSFSPEFDECRGDVATVVAELGDYLVNGIGIGKVEAGTTDRFISIEQDKRHGVCGRVQDRTLVILDLGEESMIVQDEDYRNCYTIYVSECSDISPIEKFITKSLEDLSQAREELLKGE